MADKPQPKPTERPTTRMIAKLAGISCPAVSMALRDHPRISAATRRRVQQIAQKIGYRPDPEVSKLMQHLRVRRKPAFRSTITAVTTLTADEELAYHIQIVEGARLTNTNTRSASLERTAFWSAATTGRQSSEQPHLVARLWCT